MYIRPELEDRQVIVGLVAQYQIEFEKGKKPFLSGANGVVYPAYCVKNSQKVAIKLFSPRDEPTEKKRIRSLRLFKNEIKKTQAVRHWNIIRLLDWGHVSLAHATLPFSVMQFLSHNLRDRLRNPQSLLTKLFYSAQLSDAVAFINYKGAYKGGLIHRDIKPENILVDDNDFVKVSDLGIAKFLPKFEANMIRTLGLYAEDDYAQDPRHYFSPEQLRFRFDKSVDLSRSDTFQSGKVIHEIFTGNNPIGQININNPIYKEVPRQIRIMIHGMLADFPDDRPPLEHCSAVLWVTLGLCLTNIINRTQRLPKFIKERIISDFERVDAFRLKVSDDFSQRIYWDKVLYKLYQLRVIRITLRYGTFTGGVDPFPDYSDVRQYDRRATISLTPVGIDIRNCLLLNERWVSFLGVYFKMGKSPTYSSPEYRKKVFGGSTKNWHMSHMQRRVPQFVRLRSGSTEGLYYLLRPTYVGGRWWTEIQGSQNLTQSDGRVYGRYWGTGYDVPWRVFEGETKEAALDRARKQLLREKISKVDVDMAIASQEGLVLGSKLDLLILDLDEDTLSKLLVKGRPKTFRIRIEPSVGPGPTFMDGFMRVEIDRVAKASAPIQGGISMARAVGELCRIEKFSSGDDDVIKKYFAGPVMVESHLLWFFLHVLLLVEPYCECVVERRKRMCMVNVLKPQRAEKKALSRDAITSAKQLLQLYHQRLVMRANIGIISEHQAESQAKAVESLVNEFGADTKRS